MHVFAFHEAYIMTRSMLSHEEFVNVCGIYCEVVNYNLLPSFFSQEIDQLLDNYNYS